MAKYCRNDIIREFEIAQNGCRSYFDYMYKTSQFSFAALIAIVVMTTQLINKTDAGYANAVLKIVLVYVLPIFTYIFGIMYTYNAYGLAVCGKRAEIMHRKIYEMGFEADINDGGFSDELIKYVSTDRRVTLIGYGVQLTFYFLFPFSSIVVSNYFCIVTGHKFFFSILPYIFYIVYFAMMSLIVVMIAKNFFLNKISSIIGRQIKTDEQVHSDK